MKFSKTGGKQPPQSTASKAIFQIEPYMKVRFNNDGWVEEIGRGGAEDPPGVIMQGLSGSKLDDIFARRFYDLYSRVVIFDIHPRRPTDQTCVSGVILFKDLEPDSPLYKRVNKIIELGNQNFNLNIKPLG